jgi:antitoxin component HigA of HigAB toxin-antitoxin module
MTDHPTSQDELNRMALQRQIENLTVNAKEVMELFDAHISRHYTPKTELEQARIKAFDEGYEAGANAKPPKLVDAIEFRQEQYGWNDSKMAAMLDLSKSHYSEFKNGKRALPVNSIRKAYAIGIPASLKRNTQNSRRTQMPDNTTNKLILICNHNQHAKHFMQEHRIRPADTIIVTPETTDRLQGYKNFDYYCIRPPYARELAYLNAGGHQQITAEQVDMGYSQP